MSKTTTRRTYRSRGGEKLPSVTEILGELAKPALVPWASRLAAEEAARATIRAIEDGGHPHDRAAAIGAEEGRKAPLRRTKAAADRGTLAHAFVEAWALGELGETCAVELDGVEQEEIDAAKRTADAAVQRLTDEGYRVVDAEPMISSTDLGYGGTPDLILVDKAGRLVVADLKTGKSIYREVLLQLAGYRDLLLDERDQWRAGSHVVGEADFLIIHAPAFAPSPVVSLLRLDGLGVLVHDAGTAWSATLLLHRALRQIGKLEMPEAPVTTVIGGGW